MEKLKFGIFMLLFYIVTQYVVFYCIRDKKCVEVGGMSYWTRTDVTVPFVICIF